jgi:hypothetical protein
VIVRPYEPLTEYACGEFVQDGSGVIFSPVCPDDDLGTITSGNYLDVSFDPAFVIVPKRDLPTR